MTSPKHPLRFKSAARTTGTTLLMGGLCLGLTPATADAPPAPDAAALPSEAAAPTMPWYVRAAPWQIGPPATRPSNRISEGISEAFIVFTAQTGADNPLGGLSTGHQSAPALVDLDADGDTDLVASDLFGTFTYFENTGTPTDPAFIERTGADNPFDGFDVGNYSAPTFTDLDADGDADMLSGNGLYADGGGDFLFFENTGTPTDPAFVERTGTDNPFDGLSVQAYSKPAFADLDADGDPDLIGGNGGYPFYGPDSFYYFENTGTPTDPAFVERTGTDNPLSNSFINFINSNVAPAPIDLDQDGDFDVVSGLGSYFGSGGDFFYFENTGTAAAPAFVQRTGTDNPLDGLQGYGNSTPAFTDLDGDGDTDLVSGNYTGTFHYYRNDTPAVGVLAEPQQEDVLVPPGGGGVPFSITMQNTQAVTQQVDLWRVLTLPNGAERVLGPSTLTLQPGQLRSSDFTQPIPGGAPHGSYTLTVHVGTFPDGSIAADAFTFTKLKISFDAQSIATASAEFNAAVPADLDGDGDLDVLAGAEQGERVAWYRNDGSGAFTGQPPIDTEGSTRDAIAADLDGDGDLDVLAAFVFEDTVAWYENTDGNGTFGPRHEITTAANGVRDLAAADLDNDGDTDVVAISKDDDTLRWFENTDGNGTFGPGQTIDVHNEGIEVATADIDGDGDPDVLAAWRLAGQLAWYENHNGTFSPRKDITTGGALALTVAAADLDGDGDLDVLGAFHTDPNQIAWYENTDGHGTFGTQQIITTDVDSPRAISTADLDGDGDLDALSASDRDHKIAWYENTDGHGAFGTQQTIATDVINASAASAADLDGDGDLDVLGAGYGMNLPWYATELAPEDAGAPALAGPAPPTPETLLQNYPNPFNPTTRISYTLPEAGPVRLTIYDVQGRVVAHLVDQWQDARAHHVSLAAHDWPSGLYVYRLETRDGVETRTMLLVK